MYFKTYGSQFAQQHQPLYPDNTVYIALKFFLPPLNEGRRIALCYEYDGMFVEGRGILLQLLQVLQDLVYGFPTVLSSFLYSGS